MSRMYGNTPAASYQRILTVDPDTSTWSVMYDNAGTDTRPPELDFGLVTRLMNLPSPATNGEPATKAYVDALAFGAPLPFASLPLDTAAGITVTVGEMAWNATEGTVDLGLMGGNITIQLGQHQVLRVRNNTGATLNKGDVVYVSGATGSRPTVALADASVEATSSNTIGVVGEQILNNAEGFIYTAGMITDIDTSAFTEGASVWLSETTGEFTETKPNTPAHLTLVGFIVRSHPTAGMLYVKVINYNELDELHDVLVTSITAGELLVRDPTNAYWINQTIAEAGIEPALTVATQAEMEAGTEAALRSMSPLRVAQAIAALAGSGGKVLQVVVGTTTTQVDIASTVTTYTDTGLSQSITLANAANKVLILALQTTYAAGAAYCDINIVRGTTQLQEFGYSGPYANGVASVEYTTLPWLDAPASVGPHTYKTQFRCHTTGGAGISAQFDDAGGDQVSVIILVEVAA